LSLTHGRTNDKLVDLQVVQLEELLAVRHSVFVVGNAGTGKSKVKSIASDLSLLEETFWGSIFFFLYIYIFLSLYINCAKGFHCDISIHACNLH
jgi:hypothetical protein